MGTPLPSIIRQKLFTCEYLFQALYLSECTQQGLDRNQPGFQRKFKPRVLAPGI
jgi:hypothetical protein